MYDEYSFDELLAVLEKGDADAQYALGKRYYDNSGFENAVKLFEAAARQFHVESQATLASCYEEGIGVNVDCFKADKWLMAAAEQGHEKSQMELGMRYLIGKGVNKNRETALYWYTKAARQGNKDALYVVNALNYYRSQTVLEDIQKATHLFTTYASQGSVDEQIETTHLNEPEAELMQKEQAQEESNILVQLAQLHKEIIDNPDKQDEFFGDISEEEEHSIFAIAEHIRRDRMKTRDTIFVSYKRHAQPDNDYLDELKDMLHIITRQHPEIKFFYDGSIATGADWYEEIKLNLNKARVAILLVSNEFLRSDFIYNTELPELLQAAEDDKVRIIWMPVVKSLVDKTPIENKEKGINIKITKYQSPMDTRYSLSEFDINKRSEVYDSVFRTIKKEFDIE